MAKNTQFVTHIANRETDFSQWYTDVIMVDYTNVRGCMVIKP